MRKDLFKASSRSRMPFWFIFVACIILFFVVFKFQVINKIAYPVVSLSEPLLEGRGVVARTFMSLAGTISLKSSLFIENRQLKQRLSEENGKDIIISALLSDIKELRNGFDSSNNRLAISAFVLAKPPVSIYDTIILDVGENEGVKQGSIVLAPGGIALGIIETVYPSLSRARLFSSSGEVHAVVLQGNQTVDANGAGGGILHVTVPRDFEVELGSPVTLSGERNLVLGTVEAVGSQSAGSLKTLIIRPAANMNELGFVEIVPSNILPLELN